MEFSRQEYWSELPFPSPGDLSNPGIELGSPALQQILYHLSHQGYFFFVDYPKAFSCVVAVQLLSHVQPFATP